MKVVYSCLKPLDLTPVWAVALILFNSIFCYSQEPEGPANNETEFEKQYKERIIKEKLNGVYIPKNLDDAFKELDKRINTDSKQKYKDLAEDSICIYMHTRLGQWMISNWGFYGGSRLSHYLRSAGISYPDDMADFLLIGYHRKLNEKPVEIKELALYFKENRKKEHEDELKKGKIISEEVKKKN